MVDFGSIITIAAACGFDAIAETIRKYDPIEIITACSKQFNTPPDKTAMSFMGCFQKDGRDGGYYSVLKDLKDNLKSYEWLYENLYDYTSRSVFSILMLFRLCPDYGLIKNAADLTNPQYFDKDIIRTDKDEIFVDCGGYIGDTALSYIEHCGAYKRIYVYEPSKENIEECRKNLIQKENIIITNAGVGMKSEELTFRENGSQGSFMNPNVKDGFERIRIVSLDEDIPEPVTFIKMDVEGFEVNAINGARRHIREDNAKLAICLYHVVSDFWEIPQLIHSINPNYDFYLRHYDAVENWETVLYAIPSGDER